MYTSPAVLLKDFKGRYRNTWSTTLYSGREAGSNRLSNLFREYVKRSLESRFDFMLQCFNNGKVRSYSYCCCSAHVFQGECHNTWSTSVYSGWEAHPNRLCTWFRQCEAFQRALHISGSTLFGHQ